MSTIDLNRRGLFKAGAVIAAASTISSIPVVAQAAEEPEKKIRPPHRQESQNERRA